MKLHHATESKKNIIKPEKKRSLNERPQLSESSMTLCASARKIYVYVQLCTNTLILIKIICIPNTTGLRRTKPREIATEI